MVKWCKLTRNLEVERYFDELHDLQQDRKSRGVQGKKWFLFFCSPNTVVSNETRKSTFIIFFLDEPYYRLCFCNIMYND